MKDEQALILLEKIIEVYEHQLAGSRKYDQSVYQIKAQTSYGRVEKIEYTDSRSNITIVYHINSYSGGPSMSFYFSVVGEAYSSTNIIALPYRYLLVFSKIWTTWRKLCNKIEKANRTKEAIELILKETKDQEQFNIMIHKAFPDELDNIILEHRDDDNQ